MVQTDEQSELCTILYRLLTSANELVIKGYEIPVTITMGAKFCSYNQDYNFEQFMETADKILYLAKQAGRNRYLID